MLTGQPALVASTSPRWGEQASSSSAVCVETGAVEARELIGKSTAETSAAFLRQPRAHHAGPLVVRWENGPAQSGDALRAYLTTPGLRPRLVRLPADSPDVNAAEAIGDWVRDAVTATTCLGSAAAVRDKVDPFFRGLAARVDEVKRRCRTVLHAQADTLAASALAASPPSAHADPAFALV